MAATLEEVETRLAELEQEVAGLRQLLVRRYAGETPAERGARLLREARATREEFAAGWSKAMREMGITGTPIGAEKLQELMLADGIKPEDNLLSRGIIEMREE